MENEPQELNANNSQYNEQSPIETYTVNDILRKVNSAPVENPIEEIKPQEKKKVEVEKEPEENPKEVSEKEEDEAISEIKTLKTEIEKLEKRRKGTQKSFDELSNKLKVYQKKVSKFAEDGVIEEEYAQELLNDVMHAEPEQAEEDEPNSFKFLLKLGSQGLEKIRQSMQEGVLDEDELLDKKIKCFDLFINDCSHEDLSEVMEELLKIKNDPVKLAKKMINIGKEYFEEVYQEIEEVGNLKKFKAKYNKKISELQKKLDNKEKELLEYKNNYEGYIPPKTYDLPHGGSRAVTVQTSNGNSVGEILKAAHQGKVQRY